MYHVSLADPECTSDLDDSETAAGLQPKENVVITATVNADGTTSIPKAVRTSEAQAESLGGIYFPPAYIPDATEGVIQAGLQPAPTAAVGTPFAGTINIDTGAVSMPINIRIQLQGGSGINALGTNCYVPSSSDSNGIPLNLQTGTTDPPGPNQPITGVPFNTHNGRFTVVDNSFTVGGAGSNCALLNLGASSINTSFGLPAPAGANTASFTLQTSPPLNYNGPADAGPDQFVHDSSLVTLDGSQSYNVAVRPDHHVLVGADRWTHGRTVRSRHRAPDVHVRRHRRDLHVRSHGHDDGVGHVDRLGDGHELRQRRAGRERGTRPDRQGRRATSSS